MSWHRGSRYWRGAVEIQRLMFLIVAGVGWRAPEHLPEALGVFGLIVTTIYGFAGYVNSKERDPEAIRAMAAAGDPETMRAPAQ